MARKLKAFVTTAGFFELAVAAPSMKAAATLLGVKPTAFAQGFAHETDAAPIVDATMAKPGIVLRRAVGTKSTFKEGAELPKLSALTEALRQKRPLSPQKPKKPKKPKTTKTAPRTKANAAKERKAGQLYDLAEKRRQREEERAQVWQRKEHDRRQRDVTKARGALAEARRRHEERVEDIRKQREALERKQNSENERWDSEQEKLKDALRRVEDE